MLFPVFIFAQKEQAIYEKLANQTCECVTEKKTAKLAELEISFCIVSSLEKLSDEERKVIKYNTDSDISLDKVCEQIGIKMVGICSKIFSDMLQDEETSENVITEEVIDPTSIGTFQSMVFNQFNTIVTLDSENQKKEFIWLFPFEDDTIFIKNKIVKGDKIEVKYRELNLFDPKINDYKIYNEILEVKLQ